MRRLALRTGAICLVALSLAGGAFGQGISDGALRLAPLDGPARNFSSELAEALVRSDYAAALALLDGRPALATDPAAIRLRAQLLASLGRHDEALAILEDRLTHDPADALARFQLAEVHFTTGRDKAAEHAYRLALSGALDDARRQLIATRLAALRERRDWVVNAGVSLAPDSNLNAGSNAATVDILGLPFELDDAARRRSGLALSANLGVQRRLRLDDRTRLLIGLNTAGVEAPQRAFDSAYASASLGAERVLSQNTTLSGELSNDWIWVGGALLQTHAGARLSVEHMTTRDTVWNGIVRVARISDRQSDGRDGMSVALSAHRTRYLTPSSLVRTSLTTEVRSARAAEESYVHLRAAHGRLIPLPRAVSAYLEPYAAWRQYDGANPLFGVTREDREVGASLRLAKRDWVIKGAFPFIAVSAARNLSNIPLYTFSRERLEFGLTRQF